MLQQTFRLLNPFGVKTLGVIAWLTVIAVFGLPVSSQARASGTSEQSAVAADLYSLAAPMGVRDLPPFASPFEVRRYIVVLEDSVEHPAAVADDQAEQVDGKVSLVYRAALEGYAVTMPRDEVDTLEDDPRVKYVSPDRKVQLQAQTIPTGVSRIGAVGNESVRINSKDDLRVDVDTAVIDSGVDYNHPDLDVVARTNCVPKNEFSSTIACQDESGFDGVGHGTHVAGIIGARDNGLGVTGVAPGARIWGVRVLNNSGAGYTSWVVAGVDWVTAHADRIEVANMSLTCRCSQPVLDEAIEASASAGVVYALAAGNESEDVENFSPAGNPDAITVSAISDYDGESGGKSSSGCASYGADDQLASYSNFGEEIDIAAPGTCIRSTVPSGYATLSGTSMASPHVAGAAALLASQANPNDLADVEAIRDALLSAGDYDWTDNSEDEIKEPLLNASDALQFSPVDQVANTLAYEPISESEGVLRGELNPGGVKTTYQFEYGTSTEYGNQIPVAESDADEGDEYIAVSEKVKELNDDTVYHYRLAVTNPAGTFYGSDRVFATSPPSAITEDADVLDANSAQLHGTVNPHGASTTYMFEYGRSTSYGRTAAADEILNGSEDVEVSTIAGALSSETVYHYRISASSIAGTTHGEDMTLVTGEADWAAEGMPNPERDKPGVRVNTGYNDISCVGPNNCTAVGSRTRWPASAPAEYPYLEQSNLIAHWDGTGWSGTEISLPSTVFEEYLFGVACPTERRCFAAGARWDVGTGGRLYEPGQPVVYVENSHGWSRDDGAGALFSEEEEEPDPELRPSGYPVDISCASPTYCVAVGFHGKRVEGKWRSGPLVMTWDGREWARVTVPVPASSVGGGLSSVSCSGPNACLAVGSYDRAPAEGSAPIVYAFDGHAWSILEDGGGDLGDGDDPSLARVACHGASLASVNCIVISGWREIWRYDGSDWSLESPPEPLGVEGGVWLAADCGMVSSCTVVGRFGAGGRAQTGVAHWDGEDWSRQTTTEPAEDVLASEVIALDCPDACVGVGAFADKYDEETGQAEPFAARNVVPGPSVETERASNLDAQHATLNATINPRGADTAYRFEYGETTAYGNSVPVSDKAIGEGEEAVEVSQPLSGLEGDTTYHYRVVASTRSGVTVLGDDVVFETEQPTWSQQPAPSPSGSTSSSFAASSCPSRDACIGVGGNANGSGGLFAEIWDGESWTATGSITAPSGKSSYLYDLSCPAVDACVAVGTYAVEEKGNSYPRSFAEHWDGSEWTLELLHPSGSENSELLGISCLTASSCVAVGMERLAMHWNGSGWSTQSVPLPAGGTGGSLEDVSCNATGCLAAGSYESSSGNHPLAEWWNGSKWAPLADLDIDDLWPGGEAPEGAEANLNFASCAADGCTVAGAIGGEDESEWKAAAFLASWSGSSWSPNVVSPLGLDPELASPVGLSCASIDACIVVGSRFEGEAEPYAARWNGSEWSLQVFSLPSGATEAGLSDVSCSDRGACTAVGFHSSGGAAQPLVERYE
jgi:subtilisin family serine protease